MATTSLSSRPHASAYNVPAFASGLGMTLEPIKTAAAGAGATNATTTAVTLEKVSEHEIFQDLLPSFASLLCNVLPCALLLSFMYLTAIFFRCGVLCFAFFLGCLQLRVA